MHVLMLSWEYPPHVVGGMGKHVADLLPVLASDEVHISLVTPRLNGGEPAETITPYAHVVRARLSHSAGHNFIAFVTEANRELEQAANSLYTQRGGFDIIHNHDWMTAPVALRLRHQWDIPLVTTIHATERGRGRGQLYGDHAMRINAIEQQLTSESQRLIVCSRYMSDQVGDYFGIGPGKIDIVPNAVYAHANPFSSSYERLQFRRRFAEDDQYLAFFIGRMVHEKGLHVLLDAWARLQEQINARLVIAGIGPNLELYREQARQQGLNQQALFLGQIPDADRERFYRAADVAVFPSLYEPFGIVALEAMAAECPVVVTQTGGLQEIVRPHETGITVIPDHVESLVWGILHTLQNPHWSRARALNALSDLEEIYSWHHAAREKMIIYHRIHAEWQAQRKRSSLQPSSPGIIASLEHPAL